MSDCNHITTCGNGIFTDAWGHATYILRAANKTYYFEFHPRFGPMLVNRYDEPTNEDIPVNSPFWKVWNRWHDEGMKVIVDLNGRLSCLHSDIRKLPRVE